MAGQEGSNDPEFLAKQFSTAVGRLGAVFLASHAGEEDRENDPTDGRSAADEAEQRELVEKLKTAVAKLPGEHVDLIRMLYFEHKSMTEVGQLLGKNKSTISRRHTEAIDALKAALAA
jgi:RNA polymerase sigma factor (sigma-70 family)